MSYDGAEYGLTEKYAYTQSGLVTKKRLQAQRWGKQGWMDVEYTYDAEGRVTTIRYPEQDEANARTYTYSFDAMGRPNRLTKSGTPAKDVVQGVTYGAAGEMTQMQALDQSLSSAPNLYTETRAYNARLQLTEIRVTEPMGSVVMQEQYVFSSTQNNGQIEQKTDAVSGETVTYQYDALKRLTAAATTGPEWGLSFSFDGFGNRTAQTVTKGSAPSSSLTYNMATNRLTGASYLYDAAGNLTRAPGPGGCTMNMSWDGSTG